MPPLIHADITAGYIATGTSGKETVGNAFNLSTGATEFFCTCCWEILNVSSVSNYSCELLPLISALFQLWHNEYILHLLLRCDHGVLGIRGLMRGITTLPQGNQELLVGAICRLRPSYWSIFPHCGNERRIEETPHWGGEVKARRKQRGMPLWKILAMMQLSDDVI